MNEQNTAPQNDDFVEISLLDMLIILAENKKKIIATALLFGVIAFGYATFSNNNARHEYVSKLQAAPIGFNMNKSENKSILISSDLLAAMFKSDVVLDSVIDDMNLLVKGDSRQKVRAEILIGINTEVAKDSSGVVTLSVSSQDPQKAQQIATSIYNETFKVLENIGGAFILQLISPADLPGTPQISGAKNTKKTVVLATILGLFMGIFFAFISHFWSVSSSDPETKEKIAKLNSLLGFKK
ncbi:MAG: hypothetical protein RR272_04905 [Synergistaceae bacterium]